MTECCDTWNTGSCPFHHQNIVRFDNLKTKYSINEDIHIEYTLHGHVQQASTRDWLGIFPRGWTNLQQYLTFEYAIVAPRAAASSNRTIIFPRIFHQEASTNIEYQLVYVSREIQVLATSSYFRFIRQDKTVDLANHVLQVPHGVRDSNFQKSMIHPDQLATSGWAPPHIVLSDQSLLSLRPSKTIPANPRLSRACKSCGRPHENVCGLAAGRTRFLAAHNASLAERVSRLERDLALAEGTKCSFAERLRAYENFVGQMLRSLAANGMVKITDASGKEIVLQQVLPLVAKDKVDNVDQLKNLTDKIQDRESPRSAKIDNSESKELSTNDRPLVSDYLLKEKTFITAKSYQDEDFQTQEEFNDNCKSDATVEKHRINTDVETQTQKIEAKSIGNSTSETEIHEDTVRITNYNAEDKQRALIEENDTSKASENSDEEQKEVPEKVKSTDNCEIEKSNLLMENRSETLMSKPSAIVIQGSNVKLAIIRY